MKIDLVLQNVLIGVYLLCGLMGIAFPTLLIFALLLQLAIGAWQFVNAIIFVARTQDRNRVYYLLGVLLYFFFLGFLGLLIAQKILDESPVLGLLGLVILPITLMAWYYIITRKFYHKSLAQGSIDNQAASQMDDILDADEIINNQSS